MTTEESIDTVQRPGWNPKWRKRKKHEGMAIEGLLGDQLEAFRPQADNGVFCKPQCRRWIKWKDIGFTYEVRDANTIYRLTWCNKCNNLLKEELFW
jgi:hypothetical protein